MLREIAATLRTFAVARATPPVAAAFALLLAGALVAGCGIKGPLKPPPPAAASAPSTAAPPRSAAPAAPAPAADPANPAAPAPVKR